MASSVLFITLLISPSPIFLQLVLAQAQAPQPHGLNQIYSQEPTCLCLFPNNTSTLSHTFPINQTRALQLPLLYNILANSSSCLSPCNDSSSVAPPLSSSNSSQVCLGAKNNSGVTATPVAQVASRATSFMGLGYDLRSSSFQLIILALTWILPGYLLI
ncbi:hypothetical protein N665_0608s0003 [Sinapis alba]|nr:hypothetical protein N665_0608s0003 [Sinapis alba]